ncbi:MAG: tetratricopeptide repeat protein [Anaerolineae bacterium]|nr:tetratricopeptide repeat protein [Anaerolineae bacterium]
MPSLQSAQFRHTIHFLTILREGENLYLAGGDATARGLALFDLERGNLQHCEKWITENANHDAAADQLCVVYPDAGANLLFLRQHPRERIRHQEIALEAARRLGDRAAEGRQLANLGSCYIELGEPQRAIELYQERLTLAREIGDRRGEGIAYGNLGVAYADLGAARQAIEFYEQHLNIAREVHDRRGESSALGNLGAAYSDLGETGRAIGKSDRQAIGCLAQGRELEYERAVTHPNHTHISFSHA